MERDDLKILYILQKFRDKDIGILFLTKLLYACELFYVDKYGKRFTNLKIKHYEHGPFMPELYAIVKKYVSFSTLPNGKIDNSNMKLCDGIEIIDESIFSDNDRDVISEVINKWYNRCTTPSFKGNLLDGLLSYAYSTEPLLDTPYNEEIDLLKYGKDSGISKVKLKNNEWDRIKKDVEKNKDIYKNFLERV